MEKLVQLTETEIETVAGGWPLVSDSNIVAMVNYSSVSQSATVTNTGAVTATSSGASSLAAASGASADQSVTVAQANAFRRNMLMA